MKRHTRRKFLKITSAAAPLACAGGCAGRLGEFCAGIGRGRQTEGGRMIRIPAGTYHVGSTAAQRAELAEQYGFHPSMLAEELDAADVSLKAFHIDAYPVTNAQYAAFIRATGAPQPFDWVILATAARANHPVVGVGGEDAAAYARWVGKRLPSPQEWEAAFRGISRQPDRSCNGSHWVPGTFAAASDPGPVSDFGLRGFGQLCEWTSLKIVSGRFPFRMLKGACWFCEEGWSLRPQAGFFAFAPWCRQWMGLRCAADSDVAEVPEATLPETPLPSYHTAKDPAEAVRLSFGDGRGLRVALPGLREMIGVACPEGFKVDGKPIGGPRFTAREASDATDAAKGKVRIAFRAGPVAFEALFRAEKDFFDMEYRLRGLTDRAVTVQPSTCLNAGLVDPFYDLEGSRTFFWPGRGDWIPLRALPRGRSRWVSYVKLPSGPIPSAVLAVLGRNTGTVLGYARANLTGPVAVANNFCFSCLHLDPKITVPAGGESVAHARVYCFRGGLDDLRHRIVQDFNLPRG